MNHQLVIIGNGFDLSHGLNFKYTDFLINYFHKCLFQLNVCEVKRDKKNINYFFKVYSDELLTIETQKWTDCGTEENSFQNIKRRDWYEKLNISSLTELEDIKSILERKFIVSYNTEFPLMKKILESTLKDNWIDLEKLYFKCLIEIKTNSETGIECLETQWNTLKIEFISYLKCCQKYFNSKSTSKEYSNFKNYYVLKYLFDGYEYGGKVIPKFKKYVYLNFNFSNVLNKLYTFDNKIFQIHGNLEDNFSDILFGYGWVNNNKYIDVKTGESPSFRKNLKYNYYSNKNHKRELFELMDKNPFDIKIIGHSCGESDRSLLEEIFNHSNCKSIKIYSRNQDGFENIRNNISMFNEFETSLSNKIIPFGDLTFNKISQFNSKFPLINDDYKINS